MPHDKNNDNDIPACNHHLTAMPNVPGQGVDQTVEEYFNALNMGTSPTSRTSVESENTKATLRNSDKDDDKRYGIPAHRMSCPVTRKGKPLRNVFDGSISTSEIMTSLKGHGGTSRMFARGKPRQEHLSSVGRFFSRGSTLEKATAFTKSAVAFERNAPGLSGVSRRPNQGSRPHTIADELDSNEHPVQEMQFFNVGGAKVFFYYGLDTIRSPDHVMAAGLFSSLLSLVLLLVHSLSLVAFASNRPPCEGYRCGSADARPGMSVIAMVVLFYSPLWKIFN